MNSRIRYRTWACLALFTAPILACNDDNSTGVDTQQVTVTVENVLVSKPLVESGTFQGTGTPPLILPNNFVTIRFSAAKGQRLTFATMYGWSKDLFFAPANPGIALYDLDGMPIQGDVSSQIKLWDNGSKVNQQPGADIGTKPTINESKPISEITGSDPQGISYLPASQLIQATLAYEGNSYFTLTLKNISGGTANETPLSPGVWAISYIANNDLLAPSPLYASGSTTRASLTSLSEMGDNSGLWTEISGMTGIFTPLSPVLVVVYEGNSNPIFTVGERDRGEGLKALAQMGNATPLANLLKTRSGVKAVYVLPAPETTVLLPAIGAQAGGRVTQQITVARGDRIAIATMYGFSNDWFFASSGNGVDATQKGNVSTSMTLYDNGTAIAEFPGAGNTQANLGGTPRTEDRPIEVVPNPNAFTTLPAITNIIRVSLQ